MQCQASADGPPVPREFANPTDGTIFNHDILNKIDSNAFVYVSDTFMVEDAVEAIGFGTFQWKLSILTGLSWVGGLISFMQEIVVHVTPVNSSFLPRWQMLWR